MADLEPRVTSSILAAVLVVAVTVIGPSSTSASRPLQQADGADRILGQIGGGSHDIVLRGRHAFVAVGPRVVALDLAPGADPAQLGSSDRLPGMVNRVVEDAGVAYATVAAISPDPQLVILDVSDPTRITRLAAMISSAGVNAVAAKGGYLFVANGPHGLWILDVHDPAHPTEASRLEFDQRSEGPGDINLVDIEIHHGVAYLAAAPGGLITVDVSNPRAPRLLSIPPQHGWPSNYPYAREIEFMDDILVVRNSWVDLFDLIDVSDPAQPRRIGRWFGAARSRGSSPTIGASDGIVFSRQGDYLYITDASEPSEPDRLATKLIGQGGGITVVGDRVYVPDFGGVTVFNVSDPTTPEKAERHSVFGTVQTVRFFDGWLYAPVLEYELFGGKEGIAVIDLADEAAPAVSHNVPEAVEVTDIQALDDGRALVASRHGLYELDVSSPGQPDVLRRSEVPLGLTSVASDGEYAYAPHVHASYWDLPPMREMYVMDIRPGTSMQILGGVETAAWKVRTAGDYAIVLDFGGTLAAFDITNRTMPVRGAELMFGDERLTGIPDFTIEGEHLYVTATSPDLAVYGVDPGHWQQPIGTLDVVEGHPVAVTSAGRYVYLAVPYGDDGRSQLVTVDVSRPQAPHVVQVTKLPFIPRDLDVHGWRAYLAGTDTGAWIVRVPGEPVTPPLQLPLGLHQPPGG